MTRDALRLLDVLEIRQADIMGWSKGSIIAQEMLLTSPDRVGKAVLYATAVDAEPVKEALDAMATLDKQTFVDRLFPQVWKDLNPDIYSRLPGGQFQNPAVFRLPKHSPHDIIMPRQVRPEFFGKNGPLHDGIVQE
ncbi:alpha/beta fold hydrolase [Desulfoplanes sp.]